MQQNLAAINDRDRIGQRFCFGEIMCANDDRPLGRAQTGDLVAHQTRGLRIHSGSRLVEQQYRWVMDQSARQSELLLHAFGVFTAAAPGSLGHAKVLEQILTTFFSGRWVEPVNLAKEFEIFLPGHAHVEPMLFGEHPDVGTDLPRMPGDVVSGNAGPSARRMQKSRQHTDCSCLARPILTKQRQDFPGLDV
jgi:hypothetical protein